MVSFGQLSVGLSTGYSYNTLDADPGYFYNREYLSEEGFAVAIPVQYAFNDWFSLRSEVGYVTKNYSWEREVTILSQVEAERYTNGYLQIPIMGSVSFGGDRLRGFVNGGAYVGAWLNSSVNSLLYDIFSGVFVLANGSEYEFNKERDNRFDWGVIAGLGVEYLVMPKMSLFAEGRLLYGLSDTQKNYMTDQYHRYNTTMVAQIGVLYHFNRERRR